MSDRVEGRPRLNNKLINCVLGYIRREVKKGSYAYNQNKWASLAEGQRGQPVKCGTQGCFAGWACLLSTPTDAWGMVFGRDVNEHNNYDWPGVAAEKLGLTDEEGGYLFDSATGTPEYQLAQVERRVENIRKARRTGKSISSVIYDDRSEEDE